MKTFAFSIVEPRAGCHCAACGYAIAETSPIWVSRRLERDSALTFCSRDCRARFLNLGTTTAVERCGGCRCSTVLVLPGDTRVLLPCPCVDPTLSPRRSAQ